MVFGRKEKSKSILTPKIDKRLKEIISIKSPQSFKESKSIIKLGGVTQAEFDAFEANKKMAMLQLKRGNLSKKEQKEMKEIIKVRTPQVNRF